MNSSVNVWDFNDPGNFQPDIGKFLRHQKLMKILTIGADLFPEERRTDRQTFRS
jgi:hypothetical protein